MTNEDLIEEVVTAWRPEDHRELKGHPAWFDLSPHERREAFRRTAVTRRLESALDPDGLSTTARRVLARLGSR